MEGELEDEEEEEEAEQQVVEWGQRKREDGMTK
jgi:hypothetical protein